MHTTYAKAIASVAICALGAFTEFVSGGTTGIGWAVLGLACIWPIFGGS